MMSIRKAGYGVVATATLLIVGWANAAGCSLQSESNIDAAFLEKGAVEGDGEAQAKLGLLYMTGTKSIPSDLNKASEWLERSAKSGNALGQYLIGHYLLTKGKSDSDYQRAAGFMKLASSNGCISAKFYLGIMKIKGKGVVQDVQEGMHLVKEAAEAGDGQAQIWLGSSLIAGDNIEKDPQKGFAWISRAAAFGDSASELALANLYMNGIGTKQDTAEAERLLQSVYARKDSQASVAAYMLGWMYMEAVGGVGDDAKALRWMLVAENGHVSDASKRVQKLAGSLPKASLAKSCILEMWSGETMVVGSQPVSLGEKDLIVVMSVNGLRTEVFAPDKKAVGYLPVSCFADIKAGNAITK